MARRSYAKRYAQAVFSIALETNQLDTWLSDLSKIASLGEDDEVIAWFENPRLPFDDKAKLLAQRFSDISPLALNLVYLLLSRGKLNMIGDIAEEYKGLFNSYRGIEQAQVTTAIPLEDEDKQKLAERLSTVLGKSVVLKAEVDDGIIGGIVARIGDKLLDGSTRSKLAALKKEMARR